MPEGSLTKSDLQKLHRKRLTALRRRLQFLEKRIENYQGNSSSRDQGEHAALKWALRIATDWAEAKAQPWRERFDDKRKELAALPPDWDSYGADPPTTKALDAAERFLEIVRGSWDLIPTSDGGVQLEWHANGIEVEITFTPDGEQDFE